MKKNLKLIAVAALMIVLISTACNTNSNPQAPADNLSNEVILKWNDVAYQAMGGPTPEHFLLSSRIYAMMHVAMHDALNATQPKYETYAYHQKDVEANLEVAAAAAAHQVLKIIIPAKQVFLDSVLNSYLSAIQQTEAKIGRRDVV